MNKENTGRSIETFFRQQVQKDKKVKSAFLLVHSDKSGIRMSLAEGVSEGEPVHPDQPFYTASVGKLFTSTIVSMLVEQGKLRFEDPIERHLDAGLMHKLLVVKGKDFSQSILVKHLLNHTSGLYDNFWPLLQKLLDKADPQMTPRKAVEWGKDNLRPYGAPGTRLHYADTNYHLLGMIIEHITGSPFHKVLSDFIYEPLGMVHASMLGYSTPLEQPAHPIADFFMNGKKINDLPGYAQLDYAGGGVVAPMGDLLKFMKALVNHQLVSKSTLDQMRTWKRFLVFNEYGYGIMNFKGFPLIMPGKLSSWGHAGATGAFLFYNPRFEAYLAGTFNESSWERKGVQFMFRVINKLSKHEQ